MIEGTDSRDSQQLCPESKFKTAAYTKLCR